MAMRSIAIQTGGGGARESNVASIALSGDDHFVTGSAQAEMPPHPEPSLRSDSDLSPQAAV
jgi:hypothetical protein